MKASTYSKLKERFSADEIAEIANDDKVEGYVITYYKRTQIGTYRHKVQFLFLCSIEDGKPILTKDLYKATIQDNDPKWMVDNMPTTVNGLRFDVAAQNLSEIKGRFHGVRVD